MMDYKKMRMEMIDIDIRDSVPFKQDYEDIKKKYEQAKTEADWFNIMDEHDYVNEEELKHSRKVLKALRELKKEGV